MSKSCQLHLGEEMISFKRLRSRRFRNLDRIMTLASNLSRIESLADYEHFYSSENLLICAVQLSNVIW
jgi:hypothetical protein